jgi:opacity protein-like surface antigen
MKKLVLVAMLLFGFSVLAVAQDVPVAELSGGYSYVHASAGDPSKTLNMHGWNAAFAVNVNQIAGLVIDMGGAIGPPRGPNGSELFSEKTRAFTLMAGPRINVRKGRVTPFVQALFGYARVIKGGNTINEEKEHDFAMAYGGGVDISLNQLISIRPAEVEYLAVKSGPTLLNNVRYSASIIFKFGKR